LWRGSGGLFSVVDVGAESLSPALASLYTKIKSYTSIQNHIISPNGGIAKAKGGLIILGFFDQV